MRHINNIDFASASRSTLQTIIDEDEDAIYLLEKEIEEVKSRDPLLPIPYMIGESREKAKRVMECMDRSYLFDLKRETEDAKIARDRSRASGNFLEKTLEYRRKARIFERETNEESARRQIVIQEIQFEIDELRSRIAYTLNYINRK